MSAARLRPGAISESSSSHLPPSVASKMAKPVVFPPGWLRRATMPLATGSLTPAKTIGIVRVSRWSATVAGVPLVRMISGCRPTNSFASARVRFYVDRILRGEKPGDLPVQFPTKFEMAVNLKTAKAFGLAIPPSILLRATEVVE